MAFFFRCARTGMYFPADYVEEWGKKYGIGLGSEPISEALTNRYDIPIAEAADAKRTMHPVGVCRAQVDLVDVPEEVAAERMAVLAIDDPNMNRRAAIMRDRQLLHGNKMQQLFPEEAAAVKAKEKAPIAA